MARKRAKQVEFAFPKGWGGRREGAGPKPKGERPGVSHRTRAPLASRFPVHVTARLVKGLPSLRRRSEYRVLLGAFESGGTRRAFRLVHYAVLGNHLHLLVEGKDREGLARGLQGLLIRCAKRLNRMWRRKGRVFADRYHDRILRTPREVRNALRYVLNNARKHGLVPPRREPDRFSSGRWFDGWRDFAARLEQGPLARARTWLLATGWRRHGLLRIAEVPRR